MSVSAGKTRTRRAQAAATRAHILQVALQLFGEHGYAATTTKQISAAAGVSEGSIFHHFPSKLDLLRSIPEYRTTMVGEIQELLDDPGDRSVVDVLTAITARFVSLARDEMNYIVLLVSESVGDEEVYALLRGFLEGTATRIAAYLKDQVRLGALRKDLAPTTSAQALLGALLFFLITNRHLGDAELRRRSKRYSREVVDLWLRGALPSTARVTD